MKNVQYGYFFPTSFYSLTTWFKRLSLGHVLEHNVLWIFSSSYWWAPFHRFQSRWKGQTWTKVWFPLYSFSRWAQSGAHQPSAVSSNIKHYTWGSARAFSLPQNEVLPDRREHKWGHPGLLWINWSICIQRCWYFPPAWKQGPVNTMGNQLSVGSCSPEFPQYTWRFFISHRLQSAPWQSTVRKRSTRVLKWCFQIRPIRLIMVKEKTPLFLTDVLNWSENQWTKSLCTQWLWALL